MVRGGETDATDVPSDEALALALKEGDLSAFEELVRRHQGRLYAVAYRITSNREDALDVTQEVLVKAHSKIHAWQPTGGFLAWLLRMTANQSIDHIRRRKRHLHEQLDESGRAEKELAAARPASGNPEIEARSSEIEMRIQEALGVLSPSQKAVFVLRHYEGTPLAEIADALGCTVGSVKVHLFRALRKLRKELEDLRK